MRTFNPNHSRSEDRGASTPKGCFNRLLGNLVPKILPVYTPTLDWSNPIKREAGSTEVNFSPSQCRFSGGGQHRVCWAAGWCARRPPSPSALTRPRSAEGPRALPRQGTVPEPQEAPEQGAEKVGTWGDEKRAKSWSSSGAFSVDHLICRHTHFFIHWGW